MLKIFCKHQYKAIAKRTSGYFIDYNCFSDLGWYDDVLYECQKCKKRKIKTIINEKHPLCNKWEEIKED